MVGIRILEKNVPIEFVVGSGGREEDLDREALLAGAEKMAELINSKDWPPHYHDAFREMNKIVFFEGKVMVNGHLMDRPNCDEDDAIFYWEANEFMANTDADVRANTYFHDCWHVVQYKRAGNQFAFTLARQLDREVDAISHQIGVAYTLGCDDREIKHLVDFRANQWAIIDRLRSGVNQLAGHRPGEMSGPGQ